MKLYTKSVCPKCMVVKSELANKGIEYEVLNIEQDLTARDRVIEAGFMSVPILEVDGELIGSVPAIMEKLEELSE